MPGLKGGAQEFQSDKESVDSNGSVSLADVSVNYDPGGGVRNEAFRASDLGSKETLDTITTIDSRKQIFGQDENEERGNWTGRFDFLLSLLGYAVGLGNVWRFPYLCYRNGGGAFLIPFAIMMIIVGMPLFYMEASIGQFSSCGPMTCWGFAPLFKGVGISMVLVSALTSLYYNTVLAWSFYYLFASFTSKLPWSDCYNSWNTKYCVQRLPLVSCEDGTKVEDGYCLDDEGGELGVWNDTLFETSSGMKRVSPAEEYWNNRALLLSTGIDDFGQPIWYLVLCLMLAWIVVFFCLIKGIKSTGKVVYFTAVFPYVVLLILFFRGVTLDNAGEGVKFFIIPKFERLLDARVWKDAAVQVFFSMSIAGGGLVTLSSYNRFHNNILKDTIIVCVGDFFTCIFAGFVIFSYLGFMAGQQNTTVDKVAQDGAGLAFVVYPEAVSNLPGPPFWSILFFFMLITLGLDSQFAMVETVLTGCLDQFPHLRPHKTPVILCISAIFFLLGLPFTCPGGMYLLQLFDNYVGGWTLLIIGFAENIAVAYFYGVNRFCKDLEVMLGFPQLLWWKICWWAISPLAVTFIFVFTFVDYSPSTYGDYNYPVWADILGWILAVAVIAPIIITILYKLAKDDGEYDSPLDKIRYLLTPTRTWGPYLIRHRSLIDYINDWVIDPYAEEQKYVKGSKPNSLASLSRTTSKASTLHKAGSVSTIPTISRSMNSVAQSAYSVDHSIGSYPSQYTVESTV